MTSSWADRRMGGNAPSRDPRAGAREDERWQDIPDHPGYQASDLGRIRSVDRVVTQMSRWGVISRRVPGRVLRPKVKDTGHLVVQLPGKRYRKVHQLVLEAFVGPCPPGKECCHYNGDPADNRLGNLRWDTRSNNKRDCVRLGVHHMTAKSACPRGHLLVAPNLRRAASKLGHRACLACSRARGYVRNHPGPDFEAVADRYYEELMAG